MNLTGQQLRREAQAITGALPPVLAYAERLAATVAMGVHGRKRAGMGESFWQYRHAMPGDSASNIDWRRSAQGDALFIRERELEAAQTVAFWCDDSASMAYRSHAKYDTKATRAQVLTLAIASLLARGGERLALLNTDAEKPGIGDLKVQQMAEALAKSDHDEDIIDLPMPGPRAAGHNVFISDFMGPEESFLPALNAHAAQRGAGCLVHVLDPSEEEFPYDGRVIFESMTAVVNFETLRAKALRAAYQEKLAQRSDLLKSWASSNGWHYLRHRTDKDAKPALLWLFNIIGAQI